MIELENASQAGLRHFVSVEWACTRDGERIFKLENIGVGVAFNVTAEPLVQVIQ
jgi:hypothetical protein